MAGCTSPRPILPQLTGLMSTNHEIAPRTTRPKSVPEHPIRRLSFRFRSDAKRALRQTSGSCRRWRCQPRVLAQKTPNASDDQESDAKTKDTHGQAPARRPPHRSVYPVLGKPRASQGTQLKCDRQATTAWESHSILHWHPPGPHDAAGTGASSTSTTPTASSRSRPSATG